MTTAPERAAALLADAERVAWSIADDAEEAGRKTGSRGTRRPLHNRHILAGTAYREIASELAAIDLDYAERMTQSIADQSWQSAARRAMAETLAATDPNRAVRTAQSIAATS